MRIFCYLESLKPEEGRVQPRVAESSRGHPRRRQLNDPSTRARASVCGFIQKSFEFNQVILIQKVSLLFPVLEDYKIFLKIAPRADFLYF